MSGEIDLTDKVFTIHGLALKNEEMIKCFLLGVNCFYGQNLVGLFISFFNA